MRRAIDAATRALTAFGQSSPEKRTAMNNLTDDPQAPWGGFKFSGAGREYGRYGIEAFLEPKAILES